MSASSQQPIVSGEDSFLDIIANLVGVLIILVAVVSVQAKTAIVQSSRNVVPETQTLELREQAEAAQAKAAAVESEIQGLEQTLASEQALAAQLAYERHQKLVTLELSRRQIQAQLQRLDESRRVQIEEQAEIERLAQQAERLRGELESASRVPSPHRESIPHYPTPIAKTVFSDEVHFRLSAGRLAFVPLEELVQQMKSQWKVKAEKLLTQSRTSEVVGPINGFRMHYDLIAEQVMQATGRGVEQQIGVRLDFFEIIPIEESLGETLESALREGSEFETLLKRMPPERTTISVWVYPDSFSEYNRLRSWLRERQYQTASWPLSAGRHISGSPNGMRTSAQ